MNDAAATDPPLVKEARVWRDNGWTARVIKNEDDEGWAVEMILDGEVEPVLVSPWTMGRDKRNPKPLDSVAFNTLVKTASEFRMRQVQETLRKTVAPRPGIEPGMTLFPETRIVMK